MFSTNGRSCFSFSEVGQHTPKRYYYLKLQFILLRQKMSLLFSEQHTELQQLCIPHVNTAFCKECEKRAPYTLLNFSLKRVCFELNFFSRTATNLS